MSAPPGFGSQSGQPNGDSSMEGNFFGTLTQAEIEKKARKWRQGQKKRFNEKRRMGGGGGLDMGKAVSLDGGGRVICCEQRVVAMFVRVIVLRDCMNMLTSRICRLVSSAMG